MTAPRMLTTKNDALRPARALRGWPWLLLCATLLAPMYGCTDEAELAEARAQLLLLHDLERTGAVDVLIEERTFARLEPGELSAPLGLETGVIGITVRASDGGEVLLREQVELLRTQTVLVALTGEQASEAELVVLDEPPPLLGAGQAAVEAVHLPGAARALDVYLDGALIAGSLAPDMRAPFVAVEAGSTRLEVFAAGTDPIADAPLFTTPLELLAGESVVIVLSDALVEGAEDIVVASVVSIEAVQSRVPRTGDTDLP